VAEVTTMPIVSRLAYRPPSSALNLLLVSPLSDLKPKRAYTAVHVHKSTPTKTLLSLPPVHIRTMSSDNNTTPTPTTNPPPLPQTPGPSSSFGLQLLRQKPLADPEISFSGKTVLITGANSGLGLAGATKFASLSASRVILAVRDTEAGRAAREAVITSTGFGGEVDVWELDMNSYESIIGFVRKVDEELVGGKRLDVVVLNAGVYMVEHRVGRYGVEETLQVNTLSTVLLGVLLLPKLRGKGGAVLEFVTSRRAEAVQLTEEQRKKGGLLGGLMREGDGSGYNPSERYRVSKFLTTCAMKKLASMVAADEVVVTAVCPGGVATNLSRGWTGVVATVVKALVNSVFMRTPEYAARTLISAAARGREVHGRLWYDDELHG
jgi:NAD(P)-dependent dehydrogenase (short-subunit alcohol dehydrogenase family)